MNKNLFVEKYLRGGYVFHGNRIMETDPTGQRTGEKFDIVFRNMNLFHMLVMSHYSLPCGNYKWLNSLCDPNFSVYCHC